MSEENKIEESPAEPAEVGAQNQPEIDAPVPQAKTPSAKGDPHWLPDRLDRERRKILRDLGAENVDDVKAALTELRERQDREKTELERLSGRNVELENIAKKHSALMEVVRQQALGEMSVLSDGHQAAVIAVAGDDPEKQLSALRVLRPTWVSDAAQKSGAAVAAPATTAPTVPSPTPGSPPLTNNHLATYESMEQQNPLMAAQYRLKHWADIENAKLARS